ncbi:MAG TPA: hypothetical protein VNA57_00260 [Acidimicrobiales bacterium]|nr:hypothetical protein [Acidimicrobiales bacterium]
MTGTYRALLVSAGMALVAAVVIGFAPTSAQSLVDGRELNCGSTFVSTEWSLNDACDGPTLIRAGLVMMIGLAAVGCGVVALGVRFAQAYRATGAVKTRSR